MKIVVTTKIDETVYESDPDRKVLCRVVAEPNQFDAPWRVVAGEGKFIDRATTRGDAEASATAYAIGRIFRANGE